MSTTDLNYQLDGLRNRLDELKRIEAVLLKHQGIQEQVDQKRKECSDFSEEICDIQDQIKEIEEQRRKSVGKTKDTIENRMNSILPDKNAVVDFKEDGGLVMGLHFPMGEERFIVEYSALSGGQKVMFDAAIQVAMGCSTVVIEAAELDNENLKVMLNSLKEMDLQVIVNTCHEVPDESQSDWQVEHIS